MLNTYKLKNGTRVVIENIPHLRSVSLGIWIKVGSRDEDVSTNGMSHFIEHMLFKGTYNKSAKEIAMAMDQIGGELNAFTGKECTCYYAKVLDNHIHIALDLLADMIFNSKFDKDEIEKEKTVILEEINMTQDSPEDKGHDLLSEMIYSGNPLSQNILGEPSRLKTYTREDLLKFFNNHYAHDNIVISIAGHVDEMKIIETLEAQFTGLNEKRTIRENLKYSDFNDRKFCVENKKIEQLHLNIGFDGTALDSACLYDELVLNNLLGGSMSSRLFQHIREDEGLAYSIFSYTVPYTEKGMLAIYAAISPKHLEKVTKMIFTEIENIRLEGITEAEFLMAKEQLKGSYILSLDSVGSRMSSIGKSEILLNKIYTPTEIIEKINKVKLEDVDKFAETQLTKENAKIVVVGNLEEKFDLSTLL